MHTEDVEVKSPFGRFMCWVNTGHSNNYRTNFSEREQFGPALETTGFKSWTEDVCLDCGRRVISNRDNYDRLTGRRYPGRASW